MIAPPVEIFISYSLTDKIFVERLVADLTKHQVIAWVGHMNLHGGQFWPNAVEEAIDRAQVILVIWSPKARESKYVQKEYTHAVDQDKRIIPILVMPCKIALLLQGLHWLDFTKAKAYDDRLSVLLDLLKNRDAIPLPPKLKATLVAPHPRTFLPPIVILTVVIVSLGLLASMHGTKYNSIHLNPTSSVSQTTTPAATRSTTSVPGSPVAATAVVGSAGSKATPPKGGAAPTSPVSSPAVAPTDAPTATPTPTIVPAPTASPTPVRIGQ